MARRYWAIPNLDEHLNAHTYQAALGSCYCGVDFDSEETLEDERSAHCAHTAKTWREAREILTIEELEGLPDGSVVLWRWRHGLTLACTRNRLEDGGWDHGSPAQFEDGFRRGQTCSLLWTPEDDVVSSVNSRGSL